MIGENILHYKILEKLGEGGMGVVYKAEDTKLKREVAIKFLPHCISSNEEERKRFEIEAQAAASLNHPNICTIHSIEEADENVFIVMEYIEGEELKDKIKSGPLPIDEAINIAIQIAEGLEAAHKKGIVHRDIKSGNIMITNDAKVKIMDFGLAKVGKGAQVTKIGSTVGTIAYMSPEQARGEEIDHRTDIWSFGVVIYEMITGYLPFKGDYEQAVIYSILNEEPPTLESLPIELTTILKNTLRKNPNERYENVNQMLDDLYKINGNNAYQKRETLKSNGKNKRQKLSIRWKFALGAILIAVIIIIGFWWLNQPTDQSHSSSIAVLPFKNLNGDPSQEYFSDGMTETIISDLANISGLTVISRTSVMAYKTSEKNTREIGQELNVTHILEGSIMTSGDKVRIFAQLINVNTDSHLWAQTYDREMKDIFAIQTDVATHIASVLQAKLSPEERQRIEKRSTENTEAYQLYLKGRYYWNKRSKEGVNKSIEYFQQAIDKDSTYALAYAGLGDSYLMLGVYGRRRPNESFPLAKVFIERALQFDNKLAEAYASLGDINIHFDWDVNAAEVNLRKAIELNPQYAHGYHWYSEVFVLRGEFERAFQESQRALELDPYSLIINGLLGVNYQRGGEFQKAIDQLQKTIEFDSTFAFARYDLGIVYVALKQFDRAVYNLRIAYALAPSDTRILSGLGFAEGLVGNKEEARRIEKALRDRAEREYIPPYDLAVVTLGLGKKDQALEYLERARHERGPWMPFLSLNPLFSTLSNHPRFQVLLKEMELR